LTKKVLVKDLTIQVLIKKVEELTRRLNELEKENKILRHENVMLKADNEALKAEVAAAGHHNLIVLHRIYRMVNFTT
jgi:FtsZ-binding cell division protein ZapB